MGTTRDSELATEQAYRPSDVSLGHIGGATTVHVLMTKSHADGAEHTVPAITEEC